MKNCVLSPNKICDNCGECLYCDYDPDKLCDNCGRCIGLDVDTEYRTVNYSLDKEEITIVNESQFKGIRKRREKRY